MPELEILLREDAIAILRQIVLARSRGEFGGSSTARFVFGCVDLSGKKTQYHTMLLTELEDEYEGVVHAREDPQSGLLGVSAQHVAEAGSVDVDLTDSTSTHWKQVRDQTASVRHRMQSLLKLLASQNHQALGYLAAELASENAPEDWMIALVFLTEDVHFPPEHRSSVRDSLRRIALGFRKSTRAGAERVVWAAVRRMSSLLTPQESPLLVPFLERDGVVDARAVALQCVAKLFASAPPADAQSVREIGDRAYVLATKFLDPDVFAGGEYALLAQGAVCTLAAIGDARLEETVSMALNLGKRWLKHQLRTRLNTLRKSWLSAGHGLAQSPAYRNLDVELAKLS